MTDQTRAIPTSDSLTWVVGSSSSTYISSGQYRWYELLDTGERILQQGMSNTDGGPIMWVNVKVVHENKEQHQKRTKPK